MQAEVRISKVRPVLARLGAARPGKAGMGSGPAWLGVVRQAEVRVCELG
jgi:hypothetical protein